MLGDLAPAFRRDPGRPLGCRFLFLEILGRQQIARGDRLPRPSSRKVNEILPDQRDQSATLASLAPLILAPGVGELRKQARRERVKLLFREAELQACEYPEIGPRRRLAVAPAF
jgi:hypothetical protein